MRTEFLSPHTSSQRLTVQSADGEVRLRIYDATDFTMIQLTPDDARRLAATLAEAADEQQDGPG